MRRERSGGQRQANLGEGDCGTADGEAEARIPASLSHDDKAGGAGPPPVAAPMRSQRTQMALAALLLLHSLSPDAALAVNTHSADLNRYERGTTPNVDFLITLALKEHVSLDWLLLGKGRMRRGR